MKVVHVMEKNKDDCDGWLKGKWGECEGIRNIRWWREHGKGENLNSITGSTARPFWLGSAFLRNKKQPRTQINKVLHLIIHQNKHLTLQRQDNKNEHLQKSLLKITWRTIQTKMQRAYKRKQKHRIANVLPKTQNAFIVILSRSPYLVERVGKNRIIPKLTD